MMHHMLYVVRCSTVLCKKVLHYTIKREGTNLSFHSLSRKNDRKNAKQTTGSGKLAPTAECARGTPSQQQQQNAMNPRMQTWPMNEYCWWRRVTLYILIPIFFLSNSMSASAAHHSHHFSSMTITSAFVFRRIPPLEQELGSSPTISRILGKENYYFDPLELASDENFARFRESELKHGRVAMLATIGMLAPSIVLGDSSLTAWNVVKSLTLAQYIQVISTCAFLEAFVFVQQDPKDMPGDYATGYVLRGRQLTGTFSVGNAVRSHVHFSGSL